MSQGKQRSDGVNVSNFRPIGGLIYGVIAAVISAIGVIGLFVMRVASKNVDLPNWSDEATGKFISWAFYNAHTVPVEQTVRGASGVETINLLKLYPVGDTLLFHAIPAVLLFLAGYSVATRVRSQLDAVNGVLAGASVLVGYGLIAVAGVFFLKVTQGSYTIQPSLNKTAMFMVAGYPIIFGGLGGFLRGI